MGWSKYWVLVLFLLPLHATAQDRYMVFFADKENSPYRVDQPEDFLSGRSILRRTLHDLPVTEQDLPVNASYVEQVRNAGSTILHSSKWVNGVLVTADASVMASVSSLPFVSRTELVAPGLRPVAGGRRRNGARKQEGGTASVTDQQLTMLGLSEMHAAGYRGDGMSIAVFDAGFDGVNQTQPFQHLFDEGRLDGETSYDFVYGSSDVFRHDNHGTAVLSVMAGYQPDGYTGGAYKATYQLYVTEDALSEYRVEEYYWLMAAERADSAGVDIINSSLGYSLFDDPAMSYSKDDMDGKTTVISKAAEWAAQRGMIVVTSAGNEGNNGWTIVTAPADSEWVLAIGSVNSAGVRSTSSSTGPNANGEIKPDLAAMGVNVAVIRPNGSIGVSGGTSFSSPLVASLVAGVWQRYPHLSNREVMDALKASASQAEAPDFLLGYGIPNFRAVVNRLEWEPQDELVRIFPNPLVDTLNIRPKDPVEVPECRVEILNTNGQLIDSQQVSFNWLQRSYQADCSHLAAGLYFLRVWVGEELLSYKVIKI